MPVPVAELSIPAEVTVEPDHPRQPAPARWPNLGAIHGTPRRLRQPVYWAHAIDRWYRLDDKRRDGHRFRVRYARRWYTVKSFEVRTTDRHGRGLGEQRHATDIPVPYRTCRVG